MSKVINIIPLDVQERLARGEKLNIVDVREPEEVATGRIPGAKHIRLSEIPQRMQEIDRDQETIMVCRGGNRSSQACEYLMGQGYTNVKSMMGGMMGWKGQVQK